MRSQVNDKAHHSDTNDKQQWASEVSHAPGKYGGIENGGKGDEVRGSIGSHRLRTEPGYLKL